MSKDISLEDSFTRFYMQNPDLYEEILRIARLAKANGKKRLSMRGVFEFIRFDRSLKIQGAGQYELNNSYTPLYARLVREQEPDLADLFETRGSRAPSAKVHAIDDVDDYELEMMMSLC